MSTHDASNDTYDRKIVPAETAARKEREGKDYKKTPHDQGKPNSDGYTVDSEGLTNNFAIEPEMYVDEPGDLRNEKEAAAAERTEEMAEVNQTDEEGRLSSGSDKRGKGTGVI
ncbi:hypothetical protein [Sphaerothrix gracilis]|uniref:hypothetical protein n=1 Tax=Sphaerothrix gracilis TaxID=3151835 RepID=UPI0031FDAEA5